VTAAGEAVPSAALDLRVHSDDGVTLVVPDDMSGAEPAGAAGSRGCYLAGTSEVNYLELRDGAGVYTVRVVETTLYSNWFFVGAGYSSYTLLRNTSDRAFSYAVAWRNTSGMVVASASGTIEAHATIFVDARSVAGVLAAVNGSVEVAHSGPPGAVVATTTVLSGVTGLSFDAPFEGRAPW
jgi:hypothetical protein